MKEMRESRETDMRASEGDPWQAADAVSEVLLSADQIQQRVAQLGAAISADYAGLDPLLVGALQMPWKSFLPTVVVSNSLIAATYSALGQQAVQRGWLPMAICASVAVPVALSWWWRKRLQQAG